ncbi:hypothetical protein AB0425_03880 [Actinosynnema sp. NPDC051121]
MRLFPYPEQRVLEDVAFRRGAVPTRLFAVLLPVWSVTIQARVTHAEDYELIDRYLSRGLGEAGLTTAAELADFFALEPELVDRSLRFLATIGHVVPSAGGQWSLTPLGLRSTRAGKRYVIDLQDRRKIYFDALRSRPLPKVCYDSRKVTLLTDVRSTGEGPTFYAFHPSWSLADGALSDLAHNPNRELFNLPERLDDPRRLGSDELLYLPLYVVRGEEGSHFAFTQAVDEADPQLSDLLDRSPEVTSVVDNELSAHSPEDDEERARAWLRKRDLDPGALARTAGGLLRAQLPASEFGPDSLPLSRVGSFVVQGNGFFQLWCEDTTVRANTLTARVDAYMSSRSRVDGDQVADLVQRMARQLELEDVDIDTVHRLAAAHGRSSLAAQLRRLTEGRDTHTSAQPEEDQQAVKSEP